MLNQRVQQAVSRGFSLVELLIVVAVIGVLATLAVPGYRAMVVRARNSAALSDLEQLIRCETVFFEDGNQYGRTHDTAAVAAQGTGDILIGPGGQNSVIANSGNFMVLGVSQGVHLLASTDASSGGGYGSMAKQIQGTRIFGVDSDVGAICQHAGMAHKSLAASGVSLNVSSADDLPAAAGWQRL